MGEQIKAAREEFPWPPVGSRAAYVQHEEMCDLIDRLRAERGDLVKVARVGGGPERYIRFTPDYGSERARRLAAEVFGVDLDTPWHECHPDMPGSNNCPGCGAR